jgi:hypothetical protein
MEVELIAEIKVDGSGRYSGNYEGSYAKHNRAIGLKALNQLYGYADGKIPMEGFGWNTKPLLPEQPGHSEATSTLIRGTSFRVKATLNKDGTLTIKQ